MTRKFSRNYSLNNAAAVIAILILCAAFAALAQMTGGARSVRHAVASAQPDAAAPPRVSLPPGNNAERPHVSDAGKARQSAGSLDQNPPLFLPAVTYSSGEMANPRSVVIADLNGDGKPDIVVTNDCADSCGFGGAVGVLLGNGDGTFGSVATYLTGVDEYSVAVADVNRDGHPDLVVADSKGVEILLGNGDGTFQTAYSSGGSGQSVAVADVNGDGKLDLLLGGGSEIEVLLGNGDGTFQTPVAYGSGGLGGGSGQSVAVADVNGDGKLDLLEANWGSNSVGVLLGNGDGTFQTAVTYGSGGEYPYSIAVADVNGDGKPDLIVANDSGGPWVDGVLSVLLGNGDGTFQTAVPYGSGGGGAMSVRVADVNGDGKPDLVAADWSIPPYGWNSTSGVGVLLGNGDGTFQTAEIYDLPGWDSWSVAVADVNGDGRPDVVVTMGTQVWGAVGVMLHVGDIPTTTAVVSSPNPSVYGEAVTLTATVSSSSGVPTGTVVFFNGSTELGSATLASGAATMSLSTLTVGSYSITAVYQGSLKFNSGASAPLNQVVTIANTTTSIAPTINPVLINKRVTYTATVTGQYGGAVTGSVTFEDGGVALATETLTNGHAAYTTSYQTISTHAITATYSGDSNNAGSVSATLMEQVKGFATKTAIATSGSPSYVGQPVTFTATVTSNHGAIPDGELVTFYDGKTVLASVALAQQTATYTTSSLAARTHTIKAAYPGDTIYAPSSGTVKQIVLKYPTTTALTSNPNPSSYGQPVTFAATVTLSGPYALMSKVTFFDGTTGIGSATLRAGVATLTKSTLAVGTHSITAEYLGDAYNAKSTSPILYQVVQ